MTYSKTPLSLTLATLVACLAVMPSSFAMSVDGTGELEGLVLIEESGSTVEESKQKAVKKAPAKKKAAPKKKATAKKKAAPKKKATAKKKAAPKRKAAPYDPTWEMPINGSGSTTSLPEPSSFMLLLAGFFIIGALVRRQAKQP